MAHPLILSYNLDSLTESGLSALCRQLDIGLVRVDKADYGKPIGALAGIPVAGVPSARSEDFSAPMLVLCHMLSNRLNAFLDALRESGLPRIALKAVLTPSNVGWNSRQLYEELRREHAALARGKSPRG